MKLLSWHWSLFEWVCPGKYSFQVFHCLSRLSEYVSLEIINLWMQTFVLTVRKAMPDLETLSEKRCEYCPDIWPGRESISIGDTFARSRKWILAASAGHWFSCKQTAKDNHNLGDIVFITHTWKRKERGTALHKKRTGSLPIWQLRRTLGVKHPNLKKRAQENNDKKVKMRKAKALVYHRKRKWAMVFGAKYLK